MLKIKNRN